MALRGAARAWLVTTSGFCCAFFFAAAGGCCIRQGRQSLQGRHHGSHSETDPTGGRGSRRRISRTVRYRQPTLPDNVGGVFRLRSLSVSPCVHRQRVFPRAVKRRSVGFQRGHLYCLQWDPEV